jgi:DNA-binding MarR family transcriptional regulator
MSGLAEVTNASLSRLSHLITRLERRGLVRRRWCTAGG